MVRFLLALTAFASAPALACEGNPNCSGHCNMSANSEASSAAAAVDAAAGEKLSLALTGMKCGSCAEKVSAALKGLAGVNAVAVDHTTGTAKIAYDKAKIDATAMIAAIDALGYKASIPQG